MAWRHGLAEHWRSKRTMAWFGALFVGVLVVPWLLEMPKGGSTELGVPFPYASWQPYPEPGAPYGRSSFEPWLLAADVACLYIVAIALSMAHARLKRTREHRRE